MPSKQEAMKAAGNSDVGKDTDGDGRVVMPGHKAGEIDGDKQRGKSKVGQDTDGDGRVVQPGRKPGEVDGDRQRH